MVRVSGGNGACGQPFSVAPAGACLRGVSLMPQSRACPPREAISSSRLLNFLTARIGLIKGYAKTVGRHLGAADTLGFLLKRRRARLELVARCRGGQPLQFSVAPATGCSSVPDGQRPPRSGVTPPNAQDSRCHKIKVLFDRDRGRRVVMVERCARVGRRQQPARVRSSE